MSSINQDYDLDVKKRLRKWMFIAVLLNSIWFQTAVAENKTVIIPCSLTYRYLWEHPDSPGCSMAYCANYTDNYLIIIEYNTEGIIPYLNSYGPCGSPSDFFYMTIGEESGFTGFRFIKSSCDDPNCNLEFGELNWKEGPFDDGCREGNLSGEIFVEKDTGRICEFYLGYWIDYPGGKTIRYYQEYDIGTRYEDVLRRRLLKENLEAPPVWWAESIHEFTISLGHQFEAIPGDFDLQQDVDGQDLVKFIDCMSHGCSDSIIPVTLKKFSSNYGTH